MYRIPNTNINLFTEKFNEIIEPLRSSHELIVLGDFNINLRNDDSHKRLFEICLQSNYLIPTIFAPTRVATKTLQNGQTITSETLIDNILIKANLSCTSGLIDTNISDHFPIHISIPEITLANTNTPKVIQYRLVDENRKRKFRDALSRQQNYMNNSEAKQVFSGFGETFDDLYNKYFPITSKTLTHKEEKKTWINDDLISKIKIRDKLHKLSAKKRIDSKIYKDYRNHLTSEIRKAKSIHYENEFKKSSSNLKKTWTLINEVIRTKKSRPNINITDESGGEIKGSGVSIKCVDHYTSIAETLANQLPNSPKNPSDYLQNRNENSFIFLPATPDEVENVINDLKDNGTGIHKISNEVLKYVNNVLAPIIAHILNLCTHQGYFPQELKKGCITPIFKGGKKEIINNYRPVCSLSPISKIMEKVIYNRMIKFIDKYNILSTQQYGFRKNMGTDTALINYTDTILKGLNDKLYTVSIFMDLSKSFDVLNLNILNRNLEHYGFRNYFWSF